MTPAIAASSPGVRRASSPFPCVSNVATGTTPGPTFDVIDGMLAITAAASLLARSTAAETFRSFACPEPNPLNEDVA